jgi:thioredoxin-like negative regulator of GroEL
MASSKTGRNDPCPCGSGKKYKLCCQNKTQAQQHPQAMTPQAMRMAFTQYQAGRFPQAEAVCHQVLRASPRQPDALHLLGAIALNDARIEESIRWISQAISIQPNNPEYHSNLGLALQFQGKLEAAEEQFRKAVALAPGYANAWYNLHALLIDLSGMQPAIDCMQKVVALHPSDMDARLILGVLQDYLGDTDAAIQHFDMVERGPSLFRARLDAWRYIKSLGKKLPPIIGSNIQAFKIGLDSAISQGLVLEFGVRHGTSIRQIAELAKQAVHGFDSFEGLPEVWHHEPKGSYTTKGEIPTVPKSVQLHVGWFEDTLPKFLEQHEGPVRFINVDCDIYSSTKTVLDLLAPRMVPGSVVVFDEYIGNEYWREDEFKAFQESVARYGWTYEYLCFSVFTKQVAVRINSV